MITGNDVLLKLGGVWSNQYFASQMTKLGNTGDFKGSKLENSVRIFHGISYIGAELQYVICVGVISKKHVIIEIFSSARDF